ncbi:MAG TPA: metal-sulfur cluster assembly factor [Gemmatimonadaceae bacterium]
MSDDTTTSDTPTHAPSQPTPPAPAGDAPAAPGAGARAPSSITEDMVKASLRRVKDPELNLNIVDLGLVYGISVDGDRVNVDMSLTSPGCPSGPEIMTNAEQQLRTLPGVGDVVVNLVWTPLWSPDRIEPRIRAYLGF